MKNPSTMKAWPPPPPPPPHLSAHFTWEICDWCIRVRPAACVWSGCTHGGELMGGGEDEGKFQSGHLETIRSGFMWIHTWSSWRLRALMLFRQVIVGFCFFVFFLHTWVLLSHEQKMKIWNHEGEDTSAETVPARIYMSTDEAVWVWFFRWGLRRFQDLSQGLMLSTQIFPVFICRNTWFTNTADMKSMNSSGGQLHVGVWCRRDIRNLESVVTLLL